MKRRLNAVVVAVIVCLGTPVLAGDDKETNWIDLERCAVCKHVGQHAELMSSVKCETHIIDNGMLTVVTIPAEHKDTMHAVHAKMKETIEKLKSGEKMELCGFCKSYGALMEAGAQSQEIETSFGMISLLTSDRPEVVEQIKEHAKRVVKEHERMDQAKADDPVTRK
ncbi:MAG: hypothetical protein ACYC0X_22210 [Pirellulaceae bacterium]